MTFPTPRERVNGVAGHSFTTNSGKKLPSVLALAASKQAVQNPAVGRSFVVEQESKGVSEGLSEAVPVAGKVPDKSQAKVNNTIVSERLRVAIIVLKQSSALLCGKIASWEPTRQSPGG